MANLNTNLTIVSGNVTTPVRYNDEYGIVNITLASNDSYKDKNGEWQNDPLFIDIVGNKELAKWASANIEAKDNIYVVGKLKNNEYTDKEGVTRKTIRLIASSIKMIAKHSEKPNKKDAKDDNKQNKDKTKPVPVNEEDIPF